MNFVTNITLDIYSFIILAIILFYMHKHDEKDSIQYRIFYMMIISTMWLLGADICSRFDGRPGTIYPLINYFGNTLVFILAPTMPWLWCMYIDYQVFQSKNRVKRMIPLMVAENAMFAVVVLFFRAKGWFFYIDSNNVYHRGDFYWISVFFTVLPMAVAFVTIIKNRNRIEGRYYFAFSFFPVPPMIAIVAQCLFYGTSMVLNAIAFSILIVFLNIQNQSIYTDFLTGIGNRKKLENYLKNKVKSSTFSDTFSAVMIDLDDFKEINDTYGHNMGDKALEVTTRLIKSCLTGNDFMARFGGDEFCLILDVSEQEVLEVTVHQIRRIIERYNSNSELPFDLSLSMGYAVYNHKSKMSAYEFEKKIDRLMYEQKLAKREKQCAGE